MIHKITIALLSSIGFIIPAIAMEADSAIAQQIQQTQFKPDFLTAVELFENNQLKEAAVHFEHLVMISPLASSYAKYLASYGYIDSACLSNLPNVEPELMSLDVNKQGKLWLDVSLKVLEKVKELNELRNRLNPAPQPASPPQKSTAQNVSRKRQKKAVRKEKPINVKAINLKIAVVEENLFVTLWNWTTELSHPSAAYTLMNLIVKKTFTYQRLFDGSPLENSLFTLATKALTLSDPRIYLSIDTVVSESIKKNLGIEFFDGQKKVDVSIEPICNMLKAYKRLSPQASGADHIYKLANFYLKMNDTCLPNQLMRMAAYLGNTDALYEVGNGYSPTELEAHFWLSYSAHQNNHEAQSYLAQMYYKGTAVKQNDVKSFYWAQKAVELDNPSPEDLCVLGVHYKKGRGVKKNLALAEKYMREAAGHGKRGHLFELGKLLLDQGREEEGLPYIEQAAHMGYKRALGFIIDKYLEIDCDIDKMNSFCMQVLEYEEHPEATSHLINALFLEKLSGEAETKVAEVAYKWAVQEAQSPDPVVRGKAYLTLGRLLMLDKYKVRRADLPFALKSYIHEFLPGQEVDEGVVTTYDLYRTAIDLKEENSTHYLGSYLLMNCRSDDPAVQQIIDKESAKWLQKDFKECQTGVAETAFNLAHLMSEDRGGLAFDPELIKCYLLIAKEGGVLYASYNLGNLYLNGEKGFEKNLEKAKQEFLVGMKYDHLKSVYGYAMCLLEEADEGSEQQAQRAIELLMDLVLHSDQKAIATILFLSQTKYSFLTDEVISILRKKLTYKGYNLYINLLLNHWNSMCEDKNRDSGDDDSKDQYTDTTDVESQKEEVKAEEKEPSVPMQPQDQAVNAQPSEEEVDSAETEPDDADLQPNPLPVTTNNAQSNDHEELSIKEARLMRKLNKVSGKKQVKWRKVKGVLGQTINAQGGFYRGGSGSRKKINVGGHQTRFDSPHGIDGSQLAGTRLKRAVGAMEASMTKK